jgi:hypothetical protein
VSDWAIVFWVGGMIGRSCFYGWLGDRAFLGDDWAIVFLCEGLGDCVLEEKGN